MDARSATAWVVLVLSSVLTVGFYFCSGFLADFFSSPGVTRGWKLALVGLWCYGLNKVLLAALNGRLQMKAYSLFQALRSILMVVGLAGCILYGAAEDELAVLLSFSESVLLLLLLGNLVRTGTVRLSRRLWPWARRHLTFGSRAFASGAFGELNTRVDVIILGAFVSPAKVGVYSLAATLVEGLAQLATVVRANLNPLLARYVAEGRLDDLCRAVRRTLLIFYPVMAVVAVVAIVAYPHVLALLIGNPDFSASRPVFIVLLSGLTLSCGLLPFNMILAQAGRPGLYTIYMLLVLFSKSALNIALIPSFGILGAAVATGTTYTLSAVYIALFLHNVILNPRVGRAQQGTF